jgi:hypothetical protein
VEFTADVPEHDLESEEHRAWASGQIQLEVLDTLPELIESFHGSIGIDGCNGRTSSPKRNLNCREFIHIFGDREITHTLFSVFSSNDGLIPGISALKYRC